MTLLLLLPQTSFHLVSFQFTCPLYCCCARQLTVYSQDTICAPHSIADLLLPIQFYLTAVLSLTPQSAVAMELTREHPPAYVSHDPDDLKLPSVPQQDVHSSRSPSNVTLPHFDSILAGLPSTETHSPRTQSTFSPQYPPQNDRNVSSASVGSFRTYPQSASSPHANGTYHTAMDSTVASQSDAASVMSFEGHGRRSTSIVSLEDPDVRLAAEALSGLGNPGTAPSIALLRPG